MPTSNLIPISDDSIFQGFDSVAPRLGVKPPTTPAEQAVVQAFLRFFFLGARWMEHVQEHGEALSDSFAMPGIDFDASEVMADLARKGKKH